MRKCKTTQSKVLWCRTGRHRRCDSMQIRWKERKRKYLKTMFQQHFDTFLKREFSIYGISMEISFLGRCQTLLKLERATLCQWDWALRQFGGLWCSRYGVHNWEKGRVEIYCALWTGFLIHKLNFELWTWLSNVGALCFLNFLEERAENPPGLSHMSVLGCLSVVQCTWMSTMSSVKS